MSPLNPILKQLLSLDPKALSDLLAGLSEAQIHELVYDWNLWARPAQLPPPGSWSTWLINAGRGFGKTRSGAEWTRASATGRTPMSPGAFRRIALVAETAADARDVMVEGDSGILSCHPKDFRPLYEPSKRKLTWPNGAVAHIYNATEPDQLRGPQHDCFVAGTMVSTFFGPMPIEWVRVGDFVLTRKGFKRVLHTKSREAMVGEVRFGSKKLCGTPEHLVYTPGCGWTRMDTLEQGEVLWPMSWITEGEDTPSKANRESRGITSGDPGSRGRQNEGLNTSIERSSRTRLDRSLQDGLCTTRTGTPGTTDRTTSKPSQQGLMSSGISRKTQDTRKVSEHQLSEKLKGSNAECAEPLWSERPRRGKVQSVDPALRGKLNGNEQQSDPALTVESSSCPEKEPYAPSVVSTWRPVGVRPVYCLTVEDQPEYFANGVLVHNCFWADEIAKWAYARDTWDQLQFGLRLGTNPRGVVTTTPRPIPVYLEIVRDPSTVVTNGSTMDNAANLSSKFIEKIHQRYAGTRLGRQELEAEILLDLPGALWTRSMFDPPEGSDLPGRIRWTQCPPMSRIVVGVDPSGTKNGSDDGDSIGIVVAGVDDSPGPKGPVGYVIADLTLKGGPLEWGRMAVWAYKHFKADRIVAEVNFGGAMVESTIRQVDPNVSYREVRASRGKYVRAEPISALYEQGRVRHVVGANPRDENNEGLSALEDQYCQMAPSGFNGEGSPDRVDAAVWALTDLMVEDEEGYTLGDLRRAFQ